MVGRPNLFVKIPGTQRAWRRSRDDRAGIPVNVTLLFSCSATGTAEAYSRLPACATAAAAWSRWPRGVVLRLASGHERIGVWMKSVAMTS